MILSTIASRESLKNLDKVTGGMLLVTHPEVDWKGAKGIRDIISHHSFDLNADMVFSVCKERLPGLVQAIMAMLDQVKVALSIGKSDSNSGRQSITQGLTTTIFAIEL